MFVVGAYVDYMMVPCIFIFFPVVYLLFFMTMPNTPQHLLREGKIQVKIHCMLNKLNRIFFSQFKLMKSNVLYAMTKGAENALKYYKGFKGENQLEINAFNAEFNRLKLLAKERIDDKSVKLRDFGECHFE